MKRLWRNYSLGIVLFGLFAVSWVIQTITGWWEFVAEQRSLGQSAVILGDEGYVWRWAQATFENWQSEFLQLFSFVALTAVLIHRNSAESADGDDEIKAMLEELLDRTSDRQSDREAAPTPPA